jgi:hypothetical protein
MVNFLARGDGPVATLASPAFELQALGVDASVFPGIAIAFDPPPLASLLPYNANLILDDFGTSFGFFANGTSQLVQVQGEITGWVRVPEPPVTAVTLLVAPSLAALRRRRRHDSST